MRVLPRTSFRTIHLPPDMVLFNPTETGDFHEVKALQRIFRILFSRLLAYLSGPKEKKL